MAKRALAQLAPVALAAAIVAASARALAWGDRGHDITNRAAAAALPESAPAWFRAAAERLSYLGSEPDRWRHREQKELDHARAPEHFIDLEYVGTADALPEDRFACLRLVLERDKAGELRGRAENAGLAPYAAIELAEQLEVQVAARSRLDGGGERARAAEDAAITTAGTLGHYVADLANPHHTTIHHDGWRGENPRGFRTTHGVHAEFESRFLERVASDARVRELIGPPRELESYRKAIVEHTQKSHDLVVRLYELEKLGAFTPGNEQTDAGKDGAALLHERLAAGATLLRDLWITACARAARRVHRADPDEPTPKPTPKPGEAEGPY